MRRAVANPAPPADAEALLTVGGLRLLAASRNDSGLQGAHAEAPQRYPAPWDTEDEAR